MIQPSRIDFTRYALSGSFAKSLWHRSKVAGTRRVP